MIANSFQNRVQNESRVANQIEKILASDCIDDVCIRIKKWIGIINERDSGKGLEGCGFFEWNGEVSSGIALLQKIKERIMELDGGGDALDAAGI